MARGTCGMLPTRVGLTHLCKVGLRPINASAGISQRGFLLLNQLYRPRSHCWQSLLTFNLHRYRSNIDHCGRACAHVSGTYYFKYSRCSTVVGLCAPLERFAQSSVCAAPQALLRYEARVGLPARCQHLSVVISRFADAAAQNTKHRR